MLDAIPVLSPFSVFVIIVLVFAVALVFMGVKTVPQGFEFTVERFGAGAATRLMQPSLPAPS